MEESSKEIKDEKAELIQICAEYVVAVPALSNRRQAHKELLDNAA